MARNIKFSSLAWQQYNEWDDEDSAAFAKLKEMIKQAARTPFEGIGKPEPLKHQPLQGYWSRRITKPHRFTYKATDEDLFIYACKGHYT